MKLSGSFFVFLGVGTLSGLSACGSSSDSGSPGTGGGPAATGPITSLAAGWNEIDPGGATTCALGDPYRFWVRPGKVNRVVVEFRGGGACWNGLTCAPSANLYEAKANPEPWMSDPTAANGIYDHTREDNPFKDWHHVYLSYCTGDVHWGDNEITYSKGTALEATIKHRGAVNAKAALDWIYQNVPNPERVMVAGCSAGGYGAAYWAPAVKKHYNAAKVYELADSAAGIITDTFFQDSFPAWNAVANFPEIGVDASKFTSLPELYLGIGKTYPDMFIGQYNTTYDETQSKYFTAMGGGDATAWSAKMQANLAAIEAGAPSFRDYTAADYQHCIIGESDFYTREVNGVLVKDWIADIVNDKPVEDVSCKATGCGAPKPTK